MPTPEEIAAASAAQAAAEQAASEAPEGSGVSTEEGATTAQFETTRVENLSNIPPATSVSDTSPTEQEVKDHPVYQALLTESISRRQTISTLREQIEKLPESSEEPPPSGESEPSAELRQLREIVDSLAKIVLTTQTTQRETTIRQLVAQAGLPEAASQFIDGEDKATVAAQIEALQAMTNRPSGITPGGTFVGNAPSAERIKALILGGDESDGIFSPGNQRATGGGGVERS